MRILCLLAFAQLQATLGFVAPSTALPAQPATRHAAPRSDLVKKLVYKPVAKSVLSTASKYPVLLPVANGIIDAMASTLPPRRQISAARTPPPRAPAAPPPAYAQQQQRPQPAYAAAAAAAGGTSASGPPDFSFDIAGALSWLATNLLRILDLQRQLAILKVACAHTQTHNTRKHTPPLSPSLHVLAQIKVFFMRAMDSATEWANQLAEDTRGKINGA